MNCQQVDKSPFPKVYRKTLWYSNLLGQIVWLHCIALCHCFLLWVLVLLFCLFVCCINSAGNNIKLCRPNVHQLLLLFLVSFLYLFLFLAVIFCGAYHLFMCVSGNVPRESQSQLSLILFISYWPKTTLHVFYHTCDLQSNDMASFSIWCRTQFDWITTKFYGNDTRIIIFSLSFSACIIFWNVNRLGSHLIHVAVTARYYFGYNMWLL